MRTAVHEGLAHHRQAAASVRLACAPVVESQSQCWVSAEPEVTTAPVCPPDTAGRTDTDLIYLLVGRLTS